MWSFQYASLLWPVVTSTAFLAALGICGIRNRAAPGAVAFSGMVACAMVWVLANGLTLAGGQDAARITWFKIQVALVLPMATAELCFGLAYAGLGRWLTPRLLALLAIVPLAFALLIATDGVHHLVWERIWFDGRFHVVRGPAHWGAIAYGYLLSMAYLAVLAWLFARSPRHRAIVAGIMAAFLGMRGASLLNVTSGSPLAPLNPMVLVLNLSLLPYALAIVRFRMFGVVPVARDTAIECMVEGLMVLDVEDGVADINGAAETLLGSSRSRIVGRPVGMVLHAHPDLLALLRDPSAGTGEVCLDGRTYQVSISPIHDRRGFRLGRLVTLRDVSEQKRTQARLLDQERALGMLREREQLARELHDGIGQIAVAAHIQAECASAWLDRGDTAQAGSCLQSLAEMTQEVKRSVRDYLQGVKTRSSSTEGFLVRIRRYLDEYSRQSGIQTELSVSPEFDAQRIDATIEVQLQLIIQEALTNVRKHSGAEAVRVVFAPGAHRLQVTITDGGRGFNPDALGDSAGFGLRSMRGRAEAVGGHLEIHTVPGKGTSVRLEVPWRGEEA